MTRETDEGYLAMLVDFQKDRSSSASCCPSWSLWLWLSQALSEPGMRHCNENLDIKTVMASSFTVPHQWIHDIAKLFGGVRFCLTVAEDKTSTRRSRCCTPASSQHDGLRVRHSFFFKIFRHGDCEGNPVV
mmetsp:Transcript_7733/g.13364  ORF Transcript_7733/g.13364 Transcript_7733/m.13364 type:complete len:131 (-) Transcript_7733:117-509(-)